MKKIFVCLLAVAALALTTSCNKNYAEDFEGTYNLSTTLNLQANATIMGQTISEPMDLDTTGTLTITLVGEDGDVAITNSFYGISTTGHADKEGLHMTPFSITEGGFAGDEPITITITPKVATISKDGKMTWNSAVSSNTLTATEDGMSYTISLSGTEINTATKK